MSTTKNNLISTVQDSDQVSDQVNGHEGTILLYQPGLQKIAIEVHFEDETFWLTQEKMAELYGCTRTNVVNHLTNIFEEEELDQVDVLRKVRITDNSTKPTNFYNLDAIIAVGYRVNSKQATRFRQWSTASLSEYIKKGFLLNSEMLKNGRPFGRDYFDSLLEQIREIRASERRAYQKITDIFEQCSYDYDKSSEITREFYAFVQNKLHFAVTGKTAAEIIFERSDATHPTDGLATWKNAPHGKIQKSDTHVAKNYLNEKELKRLNRLVTMYIDHAELMAEDEIPMKMQDWVDETDNFLAKSRRKVLEGKGAVSRKTALKKADAEYEQFRIKQDAGYISEFDRETAKYLKGAE